MSDEQLIFTACLVLAGSTIAAQNLDKTRKARPTVQVVIAAIIVGVFLSGIDAASPKLGRPFAYLVIVGSLLTNGTALFNYLGKLGK